MGCSGVSVSVWAVRSSWKSFPAINLFHQTAVVRQLRHCIKPTAAITLVGLQAVHPEMMRDGALGFLLNRFQRGLTLVFAEPGVLAQTIGLMLSRIPDFVNPHGHRLWQIEAPGHTINFLEPRIRGAFEFSKTILA